MADSSQTRVEIVTRLLNDAAFFDRFLQEADAALADYPDLDKFDARYLKDKIEDWGSLTAVAERFGLSVPEQPSVAPETAAKNGDTPPRLQLALHLRDDPAFFALYQKDAAAAFSAYPNLEEEDAAYIQERVTDAASLQAVIERFQTFVRTAEAKSPAESTRDADPERPSRVISTGFAPANAPDEPIGDFYTPLLAGQAYYFWFEVGEAIAESIAIEQYELPVDTPDTVLQVVLFGYEGEFELTTGADIGEIRLAANGEVVVETPAFAVPGLEKSLARRRLFFPVRAPQQAQYGRFRCNIYHQQTLLQSYQIIARVDPNPSAQTYRMMWLWHVDYLLSRFLNGHLLRQMGENIVSIMVNDNGNGTHGFRFMGQKAFKNDATLTAGAIGQLQDWTRGALRKATWGDDEPYTPGKKYQYGNQLDLKKLQADLRSMAINGFRAYDALIDSLAGDFDQATALMALMRRPGQVQIATKEAVQLVIPAAMFYDYPFLDGNAPEDYSLCPEFLKALENDDPLEKCACFQGGCPSYEADLVICPSGFWGFRHYLGLPLSVKDSADVPPRIGGSSPPKMAVSVWKGDDFKERPSHEQRLQKMGVGWEYADSRDEALDMLKATESQVVYFYCHGGLTDKGVPYLLLGDKGGDWFLRSNLRRRVRWEKVRPLVFINGCYTTQLTPERALDFVSGFVQTSGAAGVIGTEITIFEPLAVQFAEECLRRFLFEGQTIGEAVRGARLHMLKNGNPLGLVYIPYALPSLKLA